MSELGFIKTVVSDGVAKVYFNTEDELLIKESTTESTDQTYLGATINKINGFISFIQSQLDIIVKTEQETALAAQQAAEAKHQAELQHITEVTTQIQNF